MIWAVEKIPAVTDEGKAEHRVKPQEENAVSSGQFLSEGKNCLLFPQLTAGQGDAYDRVYPFI